MLDSLVELLCSLRRRPNAHQEPLSLFANYRQWNLSAFSAARVRFRHGRAAHFATIDDLRTSLLSEIVLCIARQHQQAICIAPGRKSAVMLNSVFVSPTVSFY
jgi:hypothetical protein